MAFLSMSQGCTFMFIKYVKCKDKFDDYVTLQISQKCKIRCRDFSDEHNNIQFCSQFP